MADENKDLLLDHDYDGIKELDNDMPSWWLWLFYLSIFFAVVYMLHYHVLGTGDLMHTEYKKEYNPDYVPAEPQGLLAGIFTTYKSPYYAVEGDLTPRIVKQFEAYIGPKVEFERLLMEAMRAAPEDELEKLKSSFPDVYKKFEEGGGQPAPAMAAADAGAVMQQEIVQYDPLTDEASLAGGKEIWVKNCVSCHGQGGEGGIGPNLTDDYWLHGAGMSNVAHIIKVGVPAKGMIPWESTLKEKGVLEVASYILTLHGTNPPNGKAPQGEKVEYPLVQ